MQRCSVTIATAPTKLQLPVRPVTISYKNDTKQRETSPYLAKYIQSNKHQLVVCVFLLGSPDRKKKTCTINRQTANTTELLNYVDNELSTLTVAQFLQIYFN